MKTLVTGNAGFIGFHVARSLLERGDEVIGFDIINDYYDPALKHSRLELLEATAKRSGARYHFIKGNLADRACLDACFDAHRPEQVINLAAQAGVRYSIENPAAYVESNLIGFANVLEACRRLQVKHLTYASTSSVYGANTKMPYSEKHGADHPLQFYAATKRANELMAHSYSHLFGLPTTGLRFFTVYGPWGRPDMAPMLFTKKIIAGETIDLFNNGNHVRDFTYIDDIARGVILASDAIARPDPDWDPHEPDPSRSSAPYRIFNIGARTPVQLMDFVAAIEDAVGKKATRRMLPMQPGDLPDTFADVSQLEAAAGFKPTTPFRQGVAQLVEWYRAYYRV